MQTGKVNYFNNERGFGFIRDDDGADHFFHIRTVQDAGYEKLVVGQNLSFEIGMDSRSGRARVVELELIEPIISPKRAELEDADNVFRGAGFLRDRVNR